MEGAARRFQKDLDRLKDPECPFYFDSKEAERILELAQQFEHPIGKWKTDNIKFEPWQKFFYMNLFGFINKKTGFRRFRRAHIEVGRGNAKTTMASQIALLFLTVLKDANGNFIYSVATKKEQANLVLDSAKIMATKNKTFRDFFGVEVFKHFIRCKKTFSEFKSLSSKSSTLDGLNAILCIIDELHSVDRPLLDVITTGMRKRADSLILQITTAGTDITGPGFAESEFAKGILDGCIEDDSYFCLVYCLEEDDDPRDQSLWIKANPNLGVSVDTEGLNRAVQKSLQSEAEFAGIKVKHFNIWNNEAAQYFNLAYWDKCVEPSMRLEDFKGKQCFVGWDLASVSDMTAISIIFKEGDLYYIFEKCFLPQETVDKTLNDLYHGAISRNELIATPGEAFNTTHLINEITQINEDFEVANCFYDPWNAMDVVTKLQQQGVPCEKFHQTAANFTGPMKKFLALMLENKLRHNGSQLFRWCISNVEAKVDRNENVFPRKKCDDLRFKIDPCVASFLAMRGWVLLEEQVSVYESSDKVMF